MKTLSLDIETYSSVNLGRAGVYRYAESPDFDILLLGYSIDHGPVQVVDIACGHPPDFTVHGNPGPVAIRFIFDKDDNEIEDEKLKEKVIKDIENSKYGADSNFVIMAYKMGISGATKRYEQGLSSKYVTYINQKIIELEDYYNE